MYDYVIVGGGQAGAAAVEGIRELDQSGSICSSAPSFIFPTSARR